ncbi:choice-of-anchor D domain-containing protein [Nostoc sp. UHCC 0252]|uniref:choice-of-anchor D domain-containing protein n=1 Tax=Nostoc sp. UHCC 0252 TaxID=3110241 RepID=UPI002B203FC6|nr:choice-of-anchor D domain-containing protein [Nostoc sp. UHCC 0252]MEA5604044.1 choice-of-anchor D domain-containing protein [Nostoc sp. UHCC 0252]
MATYYVSGTGSDKNNGLNEGAAFRSLGRAVYEMKTGDTLYVMNGNYEKGAMLFNKNGSPDNWTTIKAYPGHTPKIKTTGSGILVFSSSYVRIEGLDIEGNRENITLEYALQQKDNLNNSLTNSSGIDVKAWKDDKGAGGTNSHHIVISGNKVSNFPGGGIAFGNTDYITVEKNIVSGNAWYSPWGCQGISALRSFNYDSNTTDYRMIFRDNIVYDNQSLVPWHEAGKITEGHGIMLDTTIKTNNSTAYSGKALITNNTVYNNGGSGINAFKATNVDIVNNTTYQNARVLTTSGEISTTFSENIRVYNNIMYGSDDKRANVIYDAKNITYDRNLVYNSSEFQASDNLKATLQNILGKDPQFVDAAKGNFALKTGSPAIDAGSNLFNSSNTNTPQDGDGNGSALIDIGAHEAPRITSAPEIQLLNGTVDIADGSTTAINFGNVIAGSTLTKTFTIKNTGTAALNLSTLKLPDGFSLVGTLPTSVAANASTTIKVALNTTTPGTYSGTLILGNNDSNESPFDFAISGTVQTKTQVINGTTGKDTFVTKLNNGNDIITDFGGVGTNPNPSAEVIAKVDTLQFIGAGLTARNLQLTQNGNNLEVTFENVANTQVTLQNFQLENLENLGASSTRAAVGNIIFDGQTSLTDSFDVINANSTQTSIFTANTVTFLNDLNNNIVGFDNSNDVINGQGGNDTINGKSGDDLLRGNTGNDLLIGGKGNDTLMGGEGNDTLMGGEGNDLLIGGLGADAFSFNSNAAFSSDGVGIDTIADFNRSQGDKIVLSKTTFNAITSVVGTGFSKASDFESTSLGAASNAVIVYDPMTGQLLYNQNGSAAGFGTGGQFAQLTGTPTLTASDFIIQA